ncbi:MAG: hypothetical protein AB7V27_03690 [Candidatus Binatia bacterium]
MVGVSVGAVDVPVGVCVGTGVLVRVAVTGCVGVAGNEATIRTTPLFADVASCCAIGS